MKKLAAGYYIGTFKDVEFEVTKVEQINSETKNKWVWTIKNSPAQDWFNSKKDAVKAAQNFIEHDM